MPTAAVMAVAAVAGNVAKNKARHSAAAQSKQAAAKADEQIQETTGQAREDLLKLFPAAQQTGRQGFQGALDVFGQSLPAQTDVFTQGNIGAQQQILQGLPQIQNALFGNQVDYSQLQPFEVQQPDLGFFQQQLPEAVNPFAPPTNADMGVGGVLPPNDPFIGPLQTTRGNQIGGFTGSGGFNRALSGFNLAKFNGV